MRQVAREICMKKKVTEEGTCFPYIDQSTACEAVYKRKNQQEQYNITLADYVQDWKQGRLCLTD